MATQVLGQAVSTRTAPLRVVIVDDHEIVRAGLQALLTAEPDLEVVGTAASAEDALGLIDATKPDVVVLDYQLPGITGIELCSRLLERHPDLAVILLSTHLNDEVVIGAIEAGAKAYVYKDVEGLELRRAIRKVAEGGTVIDGAVADRMLSWARRRRTGPYDEPLSTREIEVLRLVADGVSNLGIADELNLTANTVKTYLRRAMKKLGAHSRGEAAAAAVKRGLL